MVSIAHSGETGRGNYDRLVQEAHAPVKRGLERGDVVSVRYRPMQPHVVADWQRLRYRANYLTQGLAEWRQVRRRSLMGRSLWRFDAIGGYPFRQGDCLRDAFAQLSETALFQFGAMLSQNVVERFGRDDRPQHSFRCGTDRVVRP